MSTRKKEKYEKAKIAAREWHRLLSKAQQENKRLIEENKKLSEENNKLQQDVKRWKSYSENLPDDDTVIDLNNTIKKLKKKNYALRTELDKIQSINSQEQLLLQNKIQNLQESRTELRERYKELRDDYRALRDINK